MQRLQTTTAAAEAKALRERLAVTTDSAERQVRLRRCRGGVQTGAHRAERPTQRLDGYRSGEITLAEGRFARAHIIAAAADDNDNFDQVVTFMEAKLKAWEDKG